MASSCAHRDRAHRSMRLSSLRCQWGEGFERDQSMLIYRVFLMNRCSGLSVPRNRVTFTGGTVNKFFDPGVATPFPLRTRLCLVKPQGYRREGACMHRHIMSYHSFFVTWFIVARAEPFGGQYMRGFDRVWNVYVVLFGRMTFVTKSCAGISRCQSVSFKFTIRLPL